jgi:hypothetical protein
VGKVRPVSLPVMLQRGHGIKPWKTRVLDLARQIDALLQRGHGIKPWKTAQDGPVEVRIYELQRGHGIKPWKTMPIEELLALTPDASTRPRH